MHFQVVLYAHDCSCDKTMRLTDEYSLNSEVCLTSGIYGIQERCRCPAGNVDACSAYSDSDMHHKLWQNSFVLSSGGKKYFDL